MENPDLGVDVDSELKTVFFSNSDAFCRILQLYARKDNIIIDPTYGNGVFWKKVDKSLYKVFATDYKRDNIDMRSLPYQDADIVINDPPYRYTPEKNKKHEDTIGHGKVDELYNLQDSKLTNNDLVLQLYYEGMQEAYRVLKLGGFLIVKCQDTIEHGKQVWVHHLLMDKAEEIGFACRDIVIVVTKSPTKTRWKKQRHFRKAHSYFLIFRKGGHFPFGMPTM